MGSVVGVARSQATLDGAVQIGAADDVTTDVQSAVREADLVYLAAPVGAVPGLLEQIAGVVQGDCIVTDAGSCKREICAAGDRFFLSGGFIGGHPMAGSERSGPLAAREDLFSGTTYFLTPTQRTSFSVVESMVSLTSALGARPVLVSAELHDQVVAATSHLPHVASAVLARVVQESIQASSEAAAGVGQGLRDMTRLARGDPELWADICIANADEIEPCLSALSRGLDELHLAIAQRDRKRIIEILTAAQRAGEQLTQ